MSPTDLDDKSKRERLREFRRDQAGGGERLRLIVMSAGLILVIGLFFYIRSFRPDSDESLTTVGDPVDLSTQIQMPPLDLGMFEDVHDNSDAERLIIEPAPFAYLLRQAIALMPGHLLHLGEPGFPFDSAHANSSALRGKPFRLRGKVLDLRPFKRVVDGPEETWLWVRTDDGHDYFFASQGVPEQLFGSGGNYVVTDGYFFKYYTQTLEGERVTAPLLVGRGLRPSVAAMDPVDAIDPVVLASATDDQFGDESEITEGDAFWHLIAWAKHLATDPDRVASEFDAALPFDRKMLADFAANPSLFRGRAVRIFGRPVRAFSEMADENPLREGYLSYAFLNKYEFGDQYVLLVAPGKQVFDGVNLSQELLGYFVRLWAYLDGDDNLRRVPLFVVAGSRQKFSPTSLIEGQITVIFLSSFLLLAALMVWLIRRDRARAVKARQQLQERRRQRRASNSTHS